VIDLLNRFKNKEQKGMHLPDYHAKASFKKFRENQAQKILQ